MILKFQSEESKVEKSFDACINLLMTNRLGDNIMYYVETQVMRPKLWTHHAFTGENIRRFWPRR